MVDSSILVPYLSHVIETIKSENQTTTHPTRNLPERLFDVYLSHDFCYLSRTKATPYKDQIIETFRSATQKDIPLPMFLDLGPGYHAALEKEDPRHLSFEIGLGELLVLYQIKRFSNRVKELYSPGVDFNIIIDNVCAVFVNDINIRDTEGYCERFRRLIKQVDVDKMVALLVESEHFSVSDYDVKPIPGEVLKSSRMSEIEYDNVKRFLGHDCSREDAIRRILVYKQIGDRTDELFYKFFQHGVHMTQRASKSTICFRSYPGGDSRIQCGKVVLGFNTKYKVYPFLLTSQNFVDYEYISFSIPKMLPDLIKEITFAHKGGV